MPNSGHITICPYYQAERNKTITCEDVYRRFKSKKIKHEYMRTYCDNKWRSCPYAQNLEGMYSRIEKGADEMTEIYKQNAKAAKEELKKVSSLLGKAEAKDEKQREAIKKLNSIMETAIKKCSELTEENEELHGKVEQLSKRNKILHNRIKNDREQLRQKESNILDELNMQASIYEGYIAYLMDKTGLEVMDVKEFHEWADKYEYRLVGIRDEENRIVSLKGEVREVSEDGDKGSSGEVSETGTPKDERSGEKTDIQCESEGLPGNDR